MPFCGHSANSAMHRFTACSPIGLLVLLNTLAKYRTCRIAVLRNFIECFQNGTSLNNAFSFRVPSARFRVIFLCCCFLLKYLTLSQHCQYVYSFVKKEFADPTLYLKAFCNTQEGQWPQTRWFDIRAQTLFIHSASAVLFAYQQFAQVISSSWNGVKQA